MVLTWQDEESLDDVGRRRHLQRIRQVGRRDHQHNRAAVCTVECIHVATVEGFCLRILMCGTY